MPLKLCAATAALLATSACATVEQGKIADSSCLAFGTLTYANAKAGEEHDDDPGNKLDTADTVLSIAAHNQAWRAVCEN